MKYFKCHEPVLAGADLLHFYEESAAKDWIDGFFLSDSKSVYAESYRKENGSDPSDDYGRARRQPEQLKQFFLRCFKIYGFDASVVEMDVEPHHVYRWDKIKKAWLIWNPGEAY